LSHRHALFSKLEAKILGFQHIPEFYSQDFEHSTISVSCHSKPQGGYYVSKGFLFEEGKLCIPEGSHRKLIVKNIHEGGLRAILELIKL